MHGESIRRLLVAKLAERPIASDCKSDARKGYLGSNPRLGTALDAVHGALNAPHRFSSTQCITFMFFIAKRINISI